MKGILIAGMIAASVFGASHVGEWSQPSARTQATEEASYLMKSFQATNANMSGYVIHSHSVLNRNFESIQTLQTNAEQLASSLHLTQVKASESQTDNEHVFVLQGQWNNATSVTMVWSSLHDFDAAMDDESILVFRAERNTTSLSAFPNDMKTTATALNQWVKNPELDAYITGTLSTHPTESQANSIIHKAFDAVSAKYVEGLRSPLVTSISGYSKEGPVSVASNQKAMNLQVALHWNNYGEHTNVVVGTPIIVDPY